MGPLQFPPFIGEQAKVHFSKKEAWLPCAGWISAAEIGTHKTDNVDAAHKEWRKEAGPCLWSVAISAGI